MKESYSIYITSDPIDIRVAVMNGSNLERFYNERKKRKTIRGNVYFGRVRRVIPGLRAAFVDIGEDKAGFLPATQVVSEELFDAASSPPEIGRGKRTRKRGVELIERSIHEGEVLPLQVIDTPGGDKGPKLTTYISIAGHYVVFMPTVSGVGVSRRIKKASQRARLRKLCINLQQQIKGGFIIRSACDGADEQKIIKEAHYLSERWNNSVKEMKDAKVPFLLMRELTLPERVIRDVDDRKVTSIICDDSSILDRMRAYAEKSSIPIGSKLRYWGESQQLFHRFGIEEKIEKTFSRKVALPSGGSIVIDTAEALTAIDVNTGSFASQQDPASVILKTNLEAVKEIAYQLRLRGIGGLIIVDLIDMEREEHKRKVYRQLIREIKKDRAKISVKKISGLGLIEMTREHYGERLMDCLQEKCWYCDGTGHLVSKGTICAKILRAILKIAAERATDIRLTAHQAIVLRLKGEFLSEINEIENKYQISISFDPRVDVHMEYFNITSA